MKSLFSKLSVLLLAAGFAVVGCQDFAEDIRQVEEKVEQSNNTLTQDFTVTTDGLKAEIAALEAQHAADIKAAEEAIAKLKADLEGKIATDIATAEAALQAAYEAADKALAAQAANDKRELEGKLAEAAANAAKALEDAKAALADAYKNADEKIEAAYKAADDKLKANLENQLGSLKSELEKADATQKSELEAKINATEKALSQAQIDINASIAALDKELSDRMSTLEGNVAGIKESVDNFVKNYEETYKLADTVLKQEIEKELDALKAEYTAGNTELTEKLADLDEAYKAADETLKESIAAEKQAVLNQLTTEKNALLEKIQGLEKTLNAKDIELENSIADLKTDLVAVKSELQTNIDAVDAALKAAEKNLQDQITANAGLIADLQEADKNLDAAIEALENTHKEDKAKLDEAIKAEAAARAAALQALTDTHDADVAVLQGAIKVNADAIAAETKAREDADATLQDNIDAVDTALKAAKTALEEADKKLQDAIEAEAKLRSDEDGKIRQDLANETLARVADVAALDGRIDELEAWQVDAQAAIDANKAAIAQNEADIELLKAADVAIKKQINDAIEKAENELAAFEAEVEKTYATKDELKKAVSDLEQKISDAVTDLESKISTLETALKGMIQANTDLIKAEETARAKADSLINVTIANTEAALKKIIAEEDQKVKDELKKEIEENVDLLKKDLTAIKDDFTKKLDEESKLRQTLEKTVNSLGGQVKDLEATAASHDLRITALENKISDAVQTINKLTSDIAGLRTDVDNLLARVQKLVYVPEYTDGKATVPYAKLDGEVVEGKKFWLTYKVYPEFENMGELVKALVGHLRADIIPVKNITRAGETATVSVHEVMASDGSHFMVALRVNDLKDEFYLEPSVDGKTSYALSLILDDENTVISSEYTNLYPENQGDITFKLYGKNTDDIDTKLTDAEPERKVPFTDVEQTFDILKTHRVTFFAGGKTIGGYNVLKNQWPELEGAFKANVKYEGDGKDLFLKENTPNETTLLNNVQVKLDPAQVNKDNVTKQINVVYEYTLGATTRSAGSVITIDKEELEFVLPAQTATWTYTLDKNADAYLFNNTLPAETYNRTFADLTADADNTASGVTIADLDGYTPTVTVTENGTVVTSPAITLTVDKANNNMDVEYNNFAWGKTYNVEAVYELPSSRVTVKFEFNTVGREAGEIDITLDPQTFKLYKDILEEGDNRSLESMVQLLKDKNYLDAEADAAEYLADYKANAPVMSGRKVVAGGADYITGETTSTGFQFNAADATNVYPKIYYANFPADKKIPTEMTYKAVITTWYGQVINISQDIKIDLPAYDYKHSEIYVKEANDGYFSQVRGKYEDSALNINLNTPDLLNFSVDKVDMFAAFSVVDENGNKLTEAAITTAGLARKFAIEVAPVSTDIKFDTDGRYLEYNGADDSVPVIGDLRLVNTNGSYAVLTTSFKTTYADYIVKKLNPIGKLAARADVLEQKILDDDVYTVNILSNFTLPENRGVGADKNYDLIDATTNNWTVGTGTNGFANSQIGIDIYDIHFSWNDIASQIPAELSDRISYDPATFTISFNNVANLGIVKDVKFNIELTISYLWGTDTASFELLFPKNIAE